MWFNVSFFHEDAEIIDPDTREALGILGYPYQKVRITEVREKFPVAVCCEERPEAKTLGQVPRSLMPPQWLYQPLSSQIKVGSLAYSIR